MACRKALERLKEAKSVDRECVRHRICPKCGGTLVRVGEVIRCTTCPARFEEE